MARWWRWPRSSKANCGPAVSSTCRAKYQRVLSNSVSSNSDPYCQIPLASREIITILRSSRGLVARANRLIDRAGRHPGPAVPRRTQNQGSSDVDNDRPQGRAYQNLWDQVRRHRLAGSAGGDPVRAHRQPDRAFQNPCEGQSFAAGAVEARVPAPAAARLPQARRRGALQDADRAAGHSSLIAFSRGYSARVRADADRVRRIAVRQPRWVPSKIPGIEKLGRTEGSKAMAGSPDAVHKTARAGAPGSLSPSCSWLSPSLNHERRLQCLTSIVWASTGAAANSSSRPAR